MHEKLKETAYFNLVHQVEQQTPEIRMAVRLTGAFAQAMFQALEANLSHDEMVAAITVGHYLGNKAENTSPAYAFLFAQMDYWVAVYVEAEQYWIRHERDG